MSTVRLTQLDGTLPNLALMRLGAWHRNRGDTVVFRRSTYLDLFEPPYDIVYGSSIFKFSEPKQEAFRIQFPQAIVGGTGFDSDITVDDIAPDATGDLDYELYPDFPHSIGFTQRGCRLRCKFCVVPQKEGKNVDAASIAAVWRGAPHPKELILLDNDFFGQPDWEKKSTAIIEGNYKISLCQGINVRLIDDSQAAILAQMRYYDIRFQSRIIYTAWDNLGDEKIVVEGIERLHRAGIPVRHIMVYMLIGYRPQETIDDILYRHQKIVDMGCLPYPMVYDRSQRELRRFQRWVIRRFYKFVPWEEYDGKVRYR